MLPDKRKKAIVYFTAIFFVFIGALIYLMIFNTGLKIEENIDDLSMQKKVFITNDSAKTIKNVSISYLEGTKKVKILGINRLKPNQTAEIVYSFPSGVEKATLIAEAPFYQTVSKEIAIGKPSTGMRYSIKSPQQIFEGAKFKVSLQICNPSTIEKQALVEEKHSPDFFSEGMITASVKIDADSCRNTDYELTPKAKGSTTIYFNINVQGISDEQNVTLNVG